MLAVPAALVQMLVWLVIVLLLTYLGLGTLLVAKPNHFLLWRQRKTQVILGRAVSPLDERDLNIGYRTLQVSYQILALTAFATITLIRPGAMLRVIASGGHIPHWRLEAGEQMFVVLLWLLALFLPYWVFPWLESDPDCEDDLEGRSGVSANATIPSRRPHWI